MTLNKQHLAVVGGIVGAFGLVSYLGWALMIKPVSAKIKLKTAERDEIQSKLDDAKKQAAQYDKFRAQAENIRRDLTLVSQRLDPDFSEREKGRVVERLVFASGVKGVKIYSDAKREKSKLGAFASLEEIPIRYEFTGGFHDLGEIVNRAVSYPRMLVPEALDIVENPGALDKDPMKVNSLEISIFVEPRGAK